MNLDATQALLIIILAFCFRDGFIAWRLLGRTIDGPPTPPTPVAAPALQPVPPGPVPPAAGAIPTAAPTAVAPHNTGITATSFGGPGDTQDSAYGGMVDPGKPGVALPASFAAPRPRVRVFRNGKSVDCDIVDKGPWYDGTPQRPADPYWQTGARPRAEADNSTNHAGIDLTPAAWTALGSSSPNAEKALVDWDFIDARATPSTPTVAPSAAGLIKNVWPTQAECPSFYGDAAAVAASLVKVPCPWVLTVEGTKTQTITIHKKCAASLARILAYIWEQCGESQAQIEAFGYNVFDGSYNPRNIAGTSTPSVHSYAAAMDWNAAANPQHAPLSQTKFKSDSLIVFAFEAEGWVWGGRWTPASIDAMHVQAARVR